ncbi:MAG: protein kinase [Micromonosporaceae bacterium]|nr:protein kinase [Micromonosporaceae bacterium]
MHGAGVQLGGRYRLDERIGGGGMGEVWRGTDEVLGRTVAVKIMLPALLDEPGFAERFRAEARTMARLKHPGVVNVYDYSSDASAAFLVMEYVEGDPLSRTLGRVGRLTAARTMALIAQAADALEAAHAAGVVHRDVKPGNLMVRANGTLVLTDFGISRSEVAGITGTGTVLGTASYLSPEQAAGQVATAASDVYALGVVAYQCLAGRRPFEGENPLEIAMKHVREPPPDLPGDIPPAVRDIVMRALAKDPANRWPSSAALSAVARQAAATLGAGMPASSSLPSGPPPSVAGSPVAPVSPVPPVPSGPSGQQTYQQGQAHVPTQPVRYLSPASQPPPPSIATGRLGSDRPSPLAVTAVILFAIAIVVCAGLVGYVVRQLVDGNDLPDLFSMITYAQPIEGSMST